MSSSHFFRSTTTAPEEKLTPLEAACKKITSNPNYQPHITKKDLLALVVTEETIKGGGTIQRHKTDKEALAIKPSSIEAKDATGNSLGVVFQLLITRKYRTSDEHPMSFWAVDDERVLFVNQQGEYSVHEGKNAINGNFDSPMPVDPNVYFSWECLHPQPEQNAEQQKMAKSPAP